MTELVTRQGLHDVAYSPTELCLLDEKNLKILYRGYDIAELAQKSSFEECAYLMLDGNLPKGAQLEEFKIFLSDMQADVFERFISNKRSGYRNLLCSMNRDAHPMDMLRTLVSFMGTNHPGSFSEFQKEFQLMELMAAMPVFVAAIGLYCAGGSRRLSSMRDVQISGAGFSASESFLKLLHSREPKEEERRALDVSLILYLEHEFNVGTHVVHAVTSANADMFSSNVAGACALKGDAHGGANEAALDLLEGIGTIQNAEAFIDKILSVDGATVKGFGHAVYKNGDPRCAIMKPIVERLANTKERRKLYELAVYVEELMLRKKNIYPNIDYWTAPLYSFLKIPKMLATPIFEMSRTVGWSAHHIEYLKLNRTDKGRLILIRPRSSQYNGHPLRQYTSMESRS